MKKTLACLPPLTLALLVAWGREAASPPVGWLAAGILLGSPLVVYLAAAGYVEATLSLLVTAALYAAWRSGCELFADLPGAIGRDCPGKTCHHAAHR